MLNLMKTRLKSLAAAATHHRVLHGALAVLHALAAHAYGHAELYGQMALIYLILAARR